MNNPIIRLFGLLLTVSVAHAETVTVSGTTVDVHLSGRTNSRTVIYVPGCNGKDEIGRLYQDFHLQRLKLAFDGDVNVLMIQIFDDITKGSKDGVCFIDTEKQNDMGANSLTLARKIGDVLPWIREQAWFNGTAHFFGFSQGGRVGVFANSIDKTRGFFKTFILIWPMCLLEYKPPIILRAHTPTRIFATENDPISQPKNCPGFYSSESPIELSLFPGDVHSWATYPSLAAHIDYWPNYKKTVTHRYVKEYADTMWSTWSAWALCMENNRQCSVSAQVIDVRLAE